MTFFRTLTAPVALVAVLASLWGCAGKGPAADSGAPNPQAAGNAAYEQKDYGRACQELTRAGGDAATQVKAATACARDGEAKAERAYKAALAANAQYAPALEGLGLAAFAAGDMSQARDLLEAAAKAGGKNPQAALALGQAYLLTGQCGPAQAALLEATRRDPSLLAAKTRLDVARLLCGAAKAVPAAGGAAAHPGSPGLSGGQGPSLSAPAGAAGAKDAPKGKPAGRTIDLNDI